VAVDAVRESGDVSDDGANGDAALEQQGEYPTARTSGAAVEQDAVHAGHDLLPSRVRATIPDNMFNSLLLTVGSSRQ
jgi:hypothetical protein